jgi:hypothetical protein
MHEHEPIINIYISARLTEAAASLRHPRFFFLKKKKDKFILNGFECGFGDVLVPIRVPDGLFSNQKYQFG